MSSKKAVPVAREPPVIGTIHAISAADIYPLPENPFQIRDDASMAELAESVKQFGILMPTEVRPRESGGYEMISGSRRKYAAELAGIDTIPAVILNLDYDDALIRMVDSNIQRENLLPSERAKAYKIRMEAMKRKAGRPAKEAENNSPKMLTSSIIDEEVTALLLANAPMESIYCLQTILVLGMECIEKNIRTPARDPLHMYITKRGLLPTDTAEQTAERAFLIQPRYKEYLSRGMQILRLK